MSTYGINEQGPLTLTTDIDQAILGVMREWMPTYLSLLATARDVQLPPFFTYTDYIDVDEIMDHQIPALVVTTAKTKKTVGGSNSKQVQAIWDVTVSAIVRGTQPAETKQRASLYEGAVRQCFLQKCRQVGGPLSDPKWNGCQVAPIKESSRKGRYLAAGIGNYNVATDAAVQAFGGPDVPNADSYVAIAQVTEIPTISFQAESEDS